MKAVICDMNYDIVKGHNTLEKFIQAYPMFSDSRECSLLKVSSVTRYKSIRSYNHTFHTYWLNPTDLLIVTMKIIGN